MTTTSITEHKLQLMHPWASITETKTVVVQPNHDQTATENTSSKVRKTGRGGDVWGLNSIGWNLCKEACNYYILHLAVLMDDSKYRIYLDKHTEKLVEQFYKYTDMAIGGELRHLSSVNGLAKPLREALRDSTLRGQQGTSRTGAWEGWYWFRSRYGTLALKWAMEAFNTKKWGAGYGGAMWGTIANTLYMFETDQITPHSFIDTCWGLQHNGGVYFNKWWSTSGIQQVLDLNQLGHYCNIYQNTSLGIQQLISSDGIKEMCECPNCTK